MLQPFTEKSYFIYIKWQLCYNESAFCKASETQNDKILRRVEQLKELLVQTASFQGGGAGKGTIAFSAANHRIHGGS